MFGFDLAAAEERDFNLDELTHQFLLKPSQGVEGPPRLRIDFGLIILKEIEQIEWPNVLFWF